MNSLEDFLSCLLKMPFIPSTTCSYVTSVGGGLACGDLEGMSIQGFTQAGIFPDAEPEKTCVCDVHEILRKHTTVK